MFICKDDIIVEDFIIPSLPKFAKFSTKYVILGKVFTDEGAIKYSRLSLSRNRMDPLKHFEISVLRHIRFVVLRKKQFEQPNFTN